MACPAPANTVSMKLADLFPDLLIIGGKRSNLRMPQGGRGSMAHIIDDVARILARPTPRRNALRLVGGLLLGALGVKRAAADDDMPAPQCSNPSCKSTEHCCNGFGQKNFCLSRSFRCCGPTIKNCPTTRVCCGSGTRAVCCGAGQRCDDGRCSSSREKDN